MEAEKTFVSNSVSKGHKKRAARIGKPLSLLARPEGFEPPTHGFVALVKLPCLSLKLPGMTKAWAIFSKWAKQVKTRKN